MPSVIEPSPQRNPKIIGLMIPAYPACEQVIKRPSAIKGKTHVGMRMVTKKKNGPQSVSQGVPFLTNLLGSPNDPPQTAPSNSNVNPITVVPMKWFLS
jgi:hypothetical protein